MRINDEKSKHTSPTTLHHLIIALHIGRDKDDLGPKAIPHLLEELHRVRPSPPLLRVPEDHPLRLDVVMDQPGYRGPKGLFLVRANPDQEPVRALDASRQRSTDTCSRADADPSLEHGRGMADAGCNDISTCWFASGTE